MIMGVNDALQIKNEEFAKDSEFTKFFIKRQVNNEIGNFKNENILNMIANSNVIVIFGMSLGATDKFWWESLGKWLIDMRSRELIIVVKVEDFSNRHPLTKIENVDKWRNHFLRQTSFTQEKGAEIRERVHILLNSDLFKIDLTKKTEKEPQAEELQGALV